MNVPDHPAVEMSSVSLSYQTTEGTVKALDHVSLSVACGSFVSIDGPSGSGKTSLINVVGGLIESSSGDVCVEGKPMSGLSADARADRRLTEIGVVFQDANLIAEFTAFENVALPLVARGYSRHDVRTQVTDALASMAIGHLADRLPGEMSGGQRQRVGVARSLVGGRRLLLADEPTGSLDESTAWDLLNLLVALAEGGTTVILATHDPKARAVAQRCFTMRNGQLAESVTSVQTSARSR